MRKDVQEIFRSTPHSKQVMMFSATLSKEIRPICKKFMQDVITPFRPLSTYFPTKRETSSLDTAFEDISWRSGFFAAAQKWWDEARLCLPYRTELFIGMVQSCSPESQTHEPVCVSWCKKNRPAVRAWAVETREKSPFPAARRTCPLLFPEGLGSNSRWAWKDESSSKNPPVQSSHVLLLHKLDHYHLTVYLSKGKKENLMFKKNVQDLVEGRGLIDVLGDLCCKPRRAWFWTFDLTAAGGLRGRRGQAHAARPAATLRQAEGEREEQEAVWAARRSRVQPGMLKSLCRLLVISHLLLFGCRHIIHNLQAIRSFLLVKSSNH